MDKMKATVSRSSNPSNREFINIDAVRGGVKQTITVTTVEDITLLENLLKYAKAMVEKKLE